MIRDKDKIPVQYYEKRKGKWRYVEEEMSYDKFIAWFAREPKGFWHGARIGHR